METTFYTLTAREIIVEGAAVQQVSGGARQLVCVRKAAEKVGAGGKVIDMAAWKADHEAEALQEELWYGDEGEAAEEVMVKPVQRAEKTGRSVLNMELWASLAVIGVMAVLLVRVLGAF